MHIYEVQVHLAGIPGTQTWLVESKEDSLDYVLSEVRKYPKFQRLNGEIVGIRDLGQLEMKR